MQFDRDSGLILASSRLEMARVQALRFASRALFFLGLPGQSRIFGLVNALFSPQGLTVVWQDHQPFVYPSGDYYWDRLLDEQQSYEPEIDAFLLLASEVPFYFVDGGANYGFWASRVASGVYGSHRVMAIEPAQAAGAVLDVNLGRFDGPDVTVLQAALAEHSGEKVALFGRRHAGVSIFRSWNRSHSEVGTARTVTINQLFIEINIREQALPVIFKIDIEGSELVALKGATDAVNGHTVMILEDCSPSHASDALQFAKNELGMRLFLWVDGVFTELSDWGELEEAKKKTPWPQKSGVNVIATKSPLWLSLIWKVGAPPHGAGKNVDRQRG